MTRDAGVQFDAFAAEKANSPLATWIVWAGPSIDQPTWALTASPHTPNSLLADLTETIAHGTGTRHTDTATRPRSVRLRTSPPAVPTTATGPTISRGL
ncbi:DUF317 domain-containing protein [Streptomyces sp. NPDC019645]|uniref:DUF317 domain-containing protein n=1 Tax=Streptomyces sp. NPDC019645 TaxID=3154786 RepID=UPI0033D4770C